ncbi:MAG: hypothetical protein PVF73_02925 [Bacteroidales bacterium]|jgi:epoxyqueuosine reductase QueG
MISREQVKEVVMKNGADLFGIASVDRFSKAPDGFHPRDIYPGTQSVLVFAIRVPSETLFAKNPVPFSHVNAMAMRKVDSMTYEISSELDMLGLKNILIPTDDPYLYWDSDKQEGRAILSLRHAAYFAGLGRLGRNNLLINKVFGSMIQIGALLTGEKFEPDPFARYEVCPKGCRICLDSCPQQALTGDTVIQKECRPFSNFKTEKGYVIKRCWECRKRCPRVLGLNGKMKLSV